MGFIVPDQGQPRNFPPDCFRRMAEFAGNPQGEAPAIHVAGSKGKGSVTAMITAMLEASGLRAARYTSPHVSEYRERITLGNRFFDEDVYVGAGNELRDLAGTLLRKDGPLEGFLRADGPGFFELLTLYFFLVVRRARCDAMVVETGIGGRLDSTNVVDPLVSVITEIELEHTDILGSTIEAIAGEKAGIIKRGKPLILMEQEAAALEVFRRTAAERGSPLVYFPEAAEARGVSIDREGSSFTLTFRRGGFFPEPLDISLRIPGEVQVKNAGLAVLAAKTAFPDIREEAVVEGLRNFTLPARFERIKDDPPFIIDGAHTPVSTDCCTRSFTSLYGRGGVLLFGCALKKDAWNMARTLAPEFSRIIITTPGGFKASDPEQVHDIFREILAGGNGGTELLFIPKTGDAIGKVLELGRETGLPALGIGSFYLASEIRNMVLGKPATAP